MTLTEKHIKKLKQAAEKIGDFGRIALIVNDGQLDIVTETRERIQDGKRAHATPGQRHE